MKERKPIKRKEDVMTVTSDYTVKIIESVGMCDFDVNELQTGPGDKVTFINTTDNPISISFIKSDFFEASFVNLTPGQQYTVTMVSSSQDDSCTCSLNCNTATNVVFYTSMPVLIVHRK